MRKYNYKAWDSKYNIVKGKIEEDDLETARNRLKTQGLTVIDIKKAFDINEMTIGSKN
jgi:Type II secretory pathway, component PulF